MSDGWQERLAAFLDGWSQMRDKGDVIYGVGVDPDEDEPRNLLASDLRAALAAAAAPGGGGVAEKIIAEWAVSLAPLAPEDVDENGHPAAWLLREVRERVLPRIAATPAGPGGGLDRDAARAAVVKALHYHGFKRVTDAAGTREEPDYDCLYSPPARCPDERAAEAAAHIVIAALAPLLPGGGS